VDHQPAPGPVKLNMTIDDSHDTNGPGSGNHIKMRTLDMKVEHTHWDAQHTASSYGIVAMTWHIGLTRRHRQVGAPFLPTGGGSPRITRPPGVFTTVVGLSRS